MKINNLKLNKLEDPEVLNRVKTFDILCLQEIQCESKDALNTKIPGYSIYAFSRKMSKNNRFFGGSAILIKKYLRPGIKIVESKNADRIWLKLSKTFFNLDRDLYFCSAYMAPESSPYSINLDHDCMSELEGEVTRFQMEGHVIAGGDFNGKTSNKEDFVHDNTDDHSPITDIASYTPDIPLRRKNCDKHLVDKRGEALIQVCKSNGLRILNGRTRGDRYGRFTRYPLSIRESPSTLDYVVVDKGFLSKISYFVVMDSMGISDHECLSVSIETGGFSVSKPKEVSISKWEKVGICKPDVFLRKIESPIGLSKINDFVLKYSNCDVDCDQMLGDLTNIFDHCSEDNVSKPRKCKRVNKKGKEPWYTSECRNAKQSLNRAVKALRKDPFNDHRKRVLFAAQKKFKKICKTREKGFRKMLSNKLLNIEEKNPTEFWNLVNKMKKYGKGKDEMSEMIEPSEWLNHFQALLDVKPVTPESMLNELHRLENEPFFSEFDRRISGAEIEKAISKLNKKAKHGPDNIVPELLCAGKRAAMPALKVFYNAIFLAARQPKLFSLNFLVSIFKKGDHCVLDNYRGIAIGSCLEKVFALILLDRLQSLTEKSNPISQNQIGFKKGHRTSDHVFVLNSIVNKIVQVNKKRLYVAFIDFRKAYDKINRDLLLLKLQRCGVKGKLYDNIKAMYKDISYLIKVKGGYLDPISSSCGLKQGGVLSPHLFNLFIDEMKMIFDESCDPVKLLKSPLSHLLYADDLILMSNSKNGLQNCLNRLENFCDTWQLEINTTKSQVIIFNPTGRILTDVFLYKKQNLENVKSYCYLGVEFSTNGTFTTARTCLNDKAQKAMSALRGVISNFQLPCVRSISLFQSLIEPIALYNSENLAHLTELQLKHIAEGKTQISDLMIYSEMGKTQNKFLKFILGVNSSCSNLAMFGELGEFPLHLKAILSLLGFWHRAATEMQESTLVSQALSFVSNNPDGTNQSVWFSTVELCLKLIGLQDHLTNPQKSSTTKFKELCKLNLKNLFMQHWKSLILNQNEGCKLRLYKKFKSEFAREPYLDHIHDFTLRKIVAKFRCSDHRLEIEVGRHRGLEVKDRICQICLGAVETEYHFLIECPLYNKLRLKFLEPDLQERWCEIFYCLTKEKSYDFAFFLQKCLQLRQTMIDMRAYFL